MRITNTCEDTSVDSMNFMRKAFIGNTTAIHLVNGICINGLINFVEPYQYIIVLNNSNKQHIIFWSTVATITLNSEMQQTINSENGNRQLNINQTILNPLKNENIKVFLCNGVKLRGNLKAYDFQEYMIIENDQQQLLILWHAIATASPMEESNIVLNLMNTEQEKISENIENNLFKSLIETTIIIFLKSGIKLTGKLSCCFYSKSGHLTHLVIDNNQIVMIQHVSTITQC